MVKLMKHTWIWAIVIIIVATASAVMISSDVAFLNIVGIILLFITVLWGLSILDNSQV